MYYWSLLFVGVLEVAAAEKVVLLSGFCVFRCAHLGGFPISGHKAHAAVAVAKVLAANEVSVHVRHVAAFHHLEDRDAPGAGRDAVAPTAVALEAMSQRRANR